MKDSQAFTRVFEIPRTDSVRDYNYPYCFDGGYDLPFKIVDWFMTKFSMDEQSVKDFISSKRYFNAEKAYLVLTDHGRAFVFNQHLLKDERNIQ